MVICRLMFDLKKFRRGKQISNLVRLNSYRSLTASDSTSNVSTPNGSTTALDCDRCLLLHTFPGMLTAFSYCITLSIQSQHLLNLFPIKSSQEFQWKKSRSQQGSHSQTFPGMCCGELIMCHTVLFHRIKILFPHTCMSLPRGVPLHRMLFLQFLELLFPASSSNSAGVNHSLLTVMHFSPETVREMEISIYIALTKTLSGPIYLKFLLVSI